VIALACLLPLLAGAVLLGGGTELAARTASRVGLGASLVTAALAAVAWGGDHVVNISWLPALGLRLHLARGVVMVGGGVLMRFLETTWPPGVPGQVHVTSEDPFHADERQFDDELQDEVEHAGGEFTFVEYQGHGHLFNDPTLVAEYQPQEAQIFTRRVLEFVDSCD
jgi:dienelactone hydrolase